MNIVKMHVCGNDFLLTQYERNINYNELAIKILDRHLGVGASRLVVIKTNPFEIFIYMKDGKEELSNSNALMCFLKYVYDKKLIRGSKVTVMSNNEKIDLEITQEIPFMASTNIGIPNFKNQMIYVNDPLDCFGRVITINNSSFTIYSFYLDGIQTVVFVDDIENSSLINMAKEISEYKIFSKKTNVTFVCVKDKKTLLVKTYAIDAGFVGSASSTAAALAAACKLGYTKLTAKCIIDGGYMDVEINKKGYLTINVPVNKIFELDYNMEEE